MLRTDDASALKQIRDYFENLGFGYLMHRLSDYGLPLLYPEFSSLQNLVKSLNPIYGLSLALFRQGHAADDWVVRKGLPSETFEAMVETGLLVQNKRRQWQTPGLIVTPLEGLLIASSTPPHYPTNASRKHPVYLGDDSLWLIGALPARFVGRRVLDVCSGSGIQGLICAARGAERVVGLEKSELATAVARFNIALNGLADRVEIRQSDLYAALGPDEKFDYFVSNPPFMPVMEDVDYPVPGAGGADGTRVMRGIMRGLPPHLSETAEGILICLVFGDRYSINFNREVLQPFAEEHGFRIRALVNDKTSANYYTLGLDKIISVTCPELSYEERRQKIKTWHERLKAQGVPADYTYWQILRFRKMGHETGLVSLPIYSPVSSDPLVALTALPNARNR